MQGRRGAISGGNKIIRADQSATAVVDSGFFFFLVFSFFRGVLFLQFLFSVKLRSK